MNDTEIDNLTDSTTQNFVPLPFWTCFFIDSVSPDGNYPISDSNLTLFCKPKVEFFSEKYGALICTLISNLVWLIGAFGMLTNVLNISVLRKSQAWSSESFKFLLIVLACFEFLACFVAIPISGLSLIIMYNINRGKTLLYAFLIIYIFCCIARSGAIIMTIFITLERYLVVAFPFQTRGLFTSWKTKLSYIIIAVVSTIAINFAWLLSIEVSENSYIGQEDNLRLDSFPYIFTGNFIEMHTSHRKFKLLTDYVAPFPILLTLNALLYLKIYSWNKNRQALSINQKREISAAKMFSVVMLILLACHTVSCTGIFFIIVYNVLYRELMYLQHFAVTLSASVNILVYLGGKQFRQELKNQVGFVWKKVVPPAKVEHSRTESSY